MSQEFGSTLGKNIVVYDLEIKNVIDGKKITWANHDKMGISVGVAFDYLTSEFKVFMDDNIEDLVHLLNRADVVSGFNILGFDQKLLNATCEASHIKPNSYDLLLESRLASGWTPDKRFPSGMRLDDHLQATFGREHLKTADVKRECMLFEHVWAERPVKTPLHGERILRHPLRAKK